MKKLKANVSQENQVLCHVLRHGIRLNFSWDTFALKPSLSTKFLSINDFITKLLGKVLRQGPGTSKFDWRHLEHNKIVRPNIQACIYLLRICTIPRHNHKWDYFSQFSDKFFFYHSSYKITWQVDYIYIIYIYMCMFNVIYS